MSSSKLRNLFFVVLFAALAGCLSDRDPKIPSSFEFTRVQMPTLSFTRTTVKPMTMKRVLLPRYRFIGTMGDSSSHLVLARDPFPEC